MVGSNPSECVSGVPETLHRTARPRLGDLLTRRIDLLDMLAISRDFLRNPAKRQGLRAAGAAFDAQRAAAAVAPDSAAPDSAAPDSAASAGEVRAAARPGADARPASPYR